MNNTKVLLDKIREWDSVFRGKKTRDSFLKSEFGKYFSVRVDINPSGGWSTLYPLATGKKPPKLSNTLGRNEELFQEYNRLQNLIGITNRPLSRDEIDRNNPKFSSSVIRKKYKGGLKTFHIEHQKWQEGVKDKIPFNNFIGKATEYLVVSELLFRRYNAQLISVDEGTDVIAVKDARMYFFQVKHASYNKQFNLERVKLTSSSFNNNLYANVFYFFVLSNINKRDTLILPAHLLNRFVNKQGSSMTILIIHKNKDIYLNEVKSENKITKYLNQSGWRNLSFS